MDNAMWSRISWLQNNASTQLKQSVTRFSQWWLREFLALFPERISQWLTGPGNAILILSQGDEFVEMRLKMDSGAQLDSARIPRLECAAPIIDDFLERHELRRNEVRIGMALPPEQFFQRKLLLPLQASDSLDEIVARDLVQKTPFKLADIHHDYAVVRDAGKLMVTQQLTRRDSVNAAAAAFRLDVGDIDFVEAASQSGSTTSGAIIALHRERARRKSWACRAALALATSAVLLALLAGGLSYWRQASILEELRPQIVKASQQAQEVRSAFARLESRQSSIGYILAKKRERPALVDIWDEVTRLLPTDSWLTELHMTEASPSQDYSISLSGFSAAAAKLVVGFDQSPLFHEAALTTAISLDPTEKRERFAMQAMVRSGVLRGTTR
jgi:general secretion pathway protein L